MIFISLVIIFLLVSYLEIACFRKRRTSKLYLQFFWLFNMINIYIIGTALPFIFKNSNLHFEYIKYLGGLFFPIIVFCIALEFLGNKKLKRKFFFIVPTISLVILLTNEWHHLFFKQYSNIIEEAIPGNYFMIHTLYTYSILFLAIILFIKGSIKNSGFFSKQTMFIVLGVSIPLITNILATFRIIPMTTYMTAVSFGFTAICFYIAIIKYKVISITPIAVRNVIDTMSDGYIVISKNGNVLDYNKTINKIFLDVLKKSDEELNLFNIIEKELIKDELKGSNIKELKENILEVINNSCNKKFEFCFKHLDNINYFETDISVIRNKHSKKVIAILLLFKDITEHKHDIEVIKDKQDIIVKQGQLVSIGELAGGVAHDINTPISAIKNGLQMIETLYEPRDENEKELLFRMNNCADKIISIVNSMRNQIRNLGTDEKVDFSLSSVINDIQVITYNKVMKKKCSLDINIINDVVIHGAPTKLGQVFTNLIVNAVQAYDENGGKIEITVDKLNEKYAIVNVKDYAGGIPLHIRDNIFKNILTTKGTEGTGLGLYLAYSVVKTEFNGDISFDTNDVGTEFKIKLNLLN